MKNSNLKVMSLLALTFVISNVCSANKFDGQTQELAAIEKRLAAGAYKDTYLRLNEVQKQTRSLIPGVQLGALPVISGRDVKKVGPYKAINYSDHIKPIRQAIDAAGRQEIDRAEQARQNGQAQAAAPAADGNPGPLGNALKAGAVVGGAGLGALGLYKGAKALLGNAKATTVDAPGQDQEEIRQEAATKIQALFRGHQIRKAEDELFVDAPGQDQKEIEEARLAEEASQKALDKYFGDPILDKIAQRQRFFEKIGAFVSSSNYHLNPLSRFRRICNHAFMAGKQLLFHREFKHAGAEAWHGTKDNIVLALQGLTFAAIMYQLPVDTFAYYVAQLGIPQNLAGGLLASYQALVNSCVVTPAVDYAGPVLSSAATNAIAYGQGLIAANPSVAAETVAETVIPVATEAAGTLAETVAPAITNAAAPGFIKTVASWMSNNLFISNGWS